MGPNDEVHSPRASIWMGLTPPKVGAFCWLAMVGKILTTDMLRRREIVMSHVSEVRYLCKRVMESTDHLFVHCEIVSSMWEHFFNKCRIEWCVLGLLASLFTMWRGTSLIGCRLIMWKIILFPVLWTVWKEMNDMVF